MSLGRLIVRTVVGGIFIGHGTQKLLGWFDGPGLEGTDEMMKALKLYPPRRNAMAVGLSETCGGAGLVLGMATPAAGAALVGTMLTAIRTVHGPKGMWNSNGGYEFNATLIAAVLALIDEGPGSLSVDHALGIEKHGKRWALAALALGAAGSYITTWIGRANAAQTAA